MGDSEVTAPQTAWQLLQIISFMVGDFQGLLQDNDSTSLPAPQYAEAPSGAHYQLRNKQSGEPRGQQQHPVYSRLLGCANWSHCICPRTSSSRPGGWGGGLKSSGSCTTGQSGWETRAWAKNHSTTGREGDPRPAEQPEMGVGLFPVLIPVTVSTLCFSPSIFTL